MSEPTGSGIAVRAFVASAIAVFAFALAAIPMTMSPGTVYTGVHLHLTGEVIQSNLVRVDRDSPAYRAGLRTGDTLSCLSLRDFNVLFQDDLFGTQPGYVPGTPIHTCVRRNGTMRPVSFVGEPRAPEAPLYENTIGIALRLFAYSLFLLCALLLVLGRPSLMTWLFYAYAIFAAPNSALSANFTTLPAPLFGVIQSFVLVTGSATPGILLLFALTVPDDVPPRGWRSIAFRAAWVVVAAAAVLGYLGYAQTAVLLSPNVLVGDEFFTMLVLAAVVMGRVASMHGKERARFGWAAFAILWAVVLDYLRDSQVLPVSVGEHIALFTIVTPLVLLYAILKRHVIDVRFVISRTLVFAIITTAIVGIIGAVDWATSAYLHEVRVAMAVDAMVTIGVAFALNRLHRWIENFVGFVLFRRKYEAETYLHRLARTLVNATQQETVDRAIVGDPYTRLDLTMAALFRLTSNAFVMCASAGSDGATTAGFEQDHDLVRFLATERTRLFLRDLTHGTSIIHGNTAQPAVAIPIFQGATLTAFALYGLHRDGTKLDPDELETLERLCDSGAQAYTLIENSRYRAQFDAAPA